MTPGFRTCNTGWLPLPLNYSGNTGKKPGAEDYRFGLRHVETLRGQLPTGAQEEMGLKKSVWKSLSLEWNWQCVHGKDCLGGALVTRDKGLGGSLSDAGTSISCTEYDEPAKEAEKEWLKRWEENQECSMTEDDRGDRSWQKAMKDNVSRRRKGATMPALTRVNIS